MYEDPSNPCVTMYCEIQYKRSFCDVRFVTEMNMEEYGGQLFENALKQLVYINLALEAALNIDVMESYDQLVDDAHTVTWLNIRALGQLRKTLNDMLDKPSRPKKTKTYALSIAFVGCTLVASLLFARKFV